jgi:WD40 repeat protein
MNPTKIDPTQVRMTQELKHTSPLVGCRFDPTGRFVFAGAQDNTILRWELSTGKKTVLTGHKSWVRALTFAQGGKVLISGDWAGRILTWPADADAPTPKHDVEAHKGWVRALVVNHQKAKWALASCGNDGLVKLWITMGGYVLCNWAEYAGHTSHVYNVAFSPDGKSLVSADLKGVVKHWDWWERTLIRDLDASVLHKYDPVFCADHGGVRSMAFSPDGSLLACAGITDVSNAFAGIGRPLVVLFDMKTGQRKQLLRPKTDFQGTCWGVIFHPDGFLTGVGGGNGGALWFWKPDAPQSFHTLALPNNARDLDLHPDGKRLAVPFFDGAVRVYDMTPKAAG